LANSVTYVYYLRDFFTRNAMAMAAAAKKVAGSARMAGLAVAALGLATTYYGAHALGSMISQYARWQDRLYEIKKVVPSVVTDFGVIEKAVRHVSSAVPLAREQIANFFDEGARAGVADETRGAAEYARQLAAFAQLAAEATFAFNMPAEQSANTLAKMKSALGMTVDEMQSFLAQISLLDVKMSTSAGNILEVVRRTGALTQSLSAGDNTLKVRLREATATVAAAMTSAGVRDEVAGTGLRNFILRAGLGKQGVKEMRAAMQMAKLDASKVAKTMRTDFVGALQMVLTAVGKIQNIEKRNAALKGIFGLRGVDAVGPLLANLGLLQQAKELSADQAARQAQWQQTMAVKFATINAHIERMTNSLKFLRDGLVAGWADEIVWVTDKIRAMADALNEMPVAKKFLGGLIGAALIIGPVLIMLGMLVWSLATLGVTAAGVGAVLGLMFNPWVLGAVALAAAAYLVIANWEQVKAWFSGLSPAIQAVTVAVGGLAAAFAVAFVLGGWIPTLIAALVIGAALVIANWEQVKAWFVGLGETIKSAVGAAIDWVVAKLQAIGGFLSSLTSWEGIKSLGAGAWDGLAAAVGAVHLAQPVQQPGVPPASQQVMDAARQRMQIESTVRSDVNVTSDVKVTAPASITLRLPNGAVAGSVPLSASASRGQNMATSEATGAVAP
jgi:TP901 family phage tail tape measure protein